MPGRRPRASHSRWCPRVAEEAEQARARGSRAARWARPANACQRREPVDRDRCSGEGGLAEEGRGSVDQRLSVGEQVLMEERGDRSEARAASHAVGRELVMALQERVAPKRREGYLPSLNEAVPEIKIGKGTRCSTIELHRPRPVIGFEPIPAAYQAKYPPPAHQARPRAVTPSRDQGSG